MGYPSLMSEPRVIYQDPHILVINKPAGLLAVPGRGPDKEDCALSRVSKTFPGTLVVHRLDQATSGLMVFARTLDMQRMLSKSFEKQTISKTYLAVVHGSIDPSLNWQEINTPIGADWPNRPKQKVDPGGKPSITLWRCLSKGRAPATSILALRPLTGRTHQLRVHLMNEGMPIVGDTLYSSGHFAAQSLKPSRMLLHAYQLEFTHPLEKRVMQFVDVPDFIEALDLKESL